MGKKCYSRVSYFKDNLAEGKPSEWRCRAGGRYLYVCEDGLVHYCSQQRGFPGVPLEQYTKADMRREYLSKKPCADYCTIACVYQVSTFDFWRDPQISEGVGARRKLTQIVGSNSAVAENNTAAVNEM
jgi:hypothetical protein